MDSMNICYLDNNSTTPVDARVVSAMLPFLTQIYANPSSSHHFGISVNEIIKRARSQVAEFIGAEDSEVFFTSGATESINIALKGISENYWEKGNHIVTVSTEHKAVLDTCKYLESKGFEITYLDVDRDGLIDLLKLKSVLREDTICVCVMYVNNETGIIQPVVEIAKLAKEVGAIYVCDATQAVGKIELDVNHLGIDVMCLSGHKMYAPKGIGALYLRQPGRIVRIPSFLHGGGHENGVRSGTLNVPGIIALAEACKIAQEEMSEISERVKRLRGELEEGLLKIEGAFLNGSSDNKIFNTTNICFPGVDANVLIGRMKNVAVSNGSACTSAVVEPSHVLTAMGLTTEEAFGSIRFSLGKYNTRQEVRTIIKLIRDSVSQIKSHA